MKIHSLVHQEEIRIRFVAGREVLLLSSVTVDIRLFTSWWGHFCLDGK